MYYLSLTTLSMQDEGETEEDCGVTAGTDVAEETDDNNSEPVSRRRRRGRGRSSQAADADQSANDILRATYRREVDNDHAPSTSTTT